MLIEMIRRTFAESGFARLCRLIAEEWEGSEAFDAFWLFAIGSVVGFLLEGIWCVLHKGRWENHAALLYGPLCVIYGVGANVIYWTCQRWAAEPLGIQLIVFALAGSAVEYLLSALQEAVFGSVSWDYSDRSMNLHGRICLQMSLIWGFLGLVFSGLVFPGLRVALRWMYNPPVIGLTLVLFVLLAADAVLSALAVLRWRQRKLEVPAQSGLTRWLDAHYPDDRMEKVYNNMEFRQRSPVQAEPKWGRKS